MVLDLQKAGMWKRFAAWLFDEILIVTLAVGIGVGLSFVLGYNEYSEKVDQAYAKYESEYGITFEITQSEYETLSEIQRENYDAAYQALTADREAMQNYNTMLNLALVIITLGIFLSVMAWEFVIPLFLKNGQTVGKKMFSLCLMRNDMVRANNLQLFTRALLGKFVIETMIPVYIVTMLFLNAMDVTGTLILAGIGIAEIVCLCVTHTNAAIHDLLAGTVVVDIDRKSVV